MSVVSPAAHRASRTVFPVVEATGLSLFEDRKNYCRTMLENWGARKFLLDIWGTEEELRRNSKRDQHHYTLILRGMLDTLDVIERGERDGKKATPEQVTILAHGLISLNHHDFDARVLRAPMPQPF